MKIKEYCENPSCTTNNLLSSNYHTKTLIPICYNSYQAKGKRSNRTAFYICKECSNPSEFSRIPFRERIYNLKINFISNSYSRRFEELIQSKKKNECLFCEQNEVKTFSPHRIDKKTTEQIPITKKCVLKLFLKDYRKYIGFLCGSCRMVYFQKFNLVKWNIAYMDQEVDVLANTDLTKQQLNEMGLVEKKKIIVFDSIGSFSTSEGIKDKPLKNRVTLPPLTVTRTQAKKIIEKYGTDEQKQALHLLSV